MEAICVGSKFGALEVIAKHPTKLRWTMRCVCGNTVEAPQCSILLGRYVSCGCARQERAKSIKGRHYQHGTPEYNAWKAMQQRCCNSNLPGYKNYGGRGISVCTRWSKSFEHFLEDMGKRPSKKHSVDRINNDANYEPSNCRWATGLEQANNRRKRPDTRMLEAFGQCKSIRAWALEKGIPYNTLFIRISRGWEIERALTTM